ncbi:hypothetical protein FH972_007128 [Carpinus fangiana]|uniref:Uncharacterized protein n=1 Tax=Carpinus fangiana TaxID=176857 RepID=A0A5N6QXY4_9ROSI|nr:hypothetical protein FH972_007128 [Carpinus fangiana]
MMELLGYTRVHQKRSWQQQQWEQQQWKQQQLEQILEKCAEIQKRLEKYDQTNQEIKAPTFHGDDPNSMERVKESELVPKEIESMELEKIHPVLVKVDTQVESLGFVDVKLKDVHNDASLPCEFASPVMDNFFPSKKRSWQQQQLVQILEKGAEIQKMIEKCDQKIQEIKASRLEFPTLHGDDPDSMERVKESELVPKEIESMELEKIHPVLEKVDTQVESLGFLDVKPNDVHKEEFLDLSQERESMDCKKLHLILAIGEQDLVKRVSTCGRLSCNEVQLFDRTPQKKLDDEVKLVKNFQEWKSRMVNEVLQRVQKLWHRWRWKYRREVLGRKNTQSAWESKKDGWLVASRVVCGVPSHEFQSQRARASNDSYLAKAVADGNERKMDGQWPVKRCVGFHLMSSSSNLKEHGHLMILMQQSKKSGGHLELLS